MRAFNFRLQTKLNLCKNQEKAAKERLMVCLASLEKLRTEQNKIRQRIAAIENNIRCLNQENKYNQELLINNEYLHVINNKDKELTGHIIDATQLVEEARQELIERRKETSSLEKLRERKWDEYMHETNLEEQKNTDESALIGFLRKQE